MAFHWQTFRTRALSAVVFVLIMAIGLLWNEWSFVVLFSIVHFGCWVEYRKLVVQIDKGAGAITPGFWFDAYLLGWGILLQFAGTPTGLDPAVISWTSVAGFGRSITSLGIILLIVNFFITNRKIKPVHFLPVLAGFLYISLSLGLLVGICTASHFKVPAHGWVIVLLIIFTNWINDTMAYLVGSLIGKTPFSPISPKKTWEGTIGGMILAVVTISLIAHFFNLLPLRHAAALSAIGAATGTYGDLFESKLKRLAGVKDSGTMMPGHGGFLDRFDSLLFSATACAIYVALAMK